jgi:pimeloyl-ACP methyl ester carboxylesterase
MKKIILIVIVFLTQIIFAQSKYSFAVKIVGKGTPIIMIPGYGCGGEVWNETAEKLKNKYECHILSLPGFAGQKPINDPVLETVRGEVISYVKEKKLTNTILMGHSLGGFMTLWIGSSAPSMFSKIIVVDGLPFVSAAGNPSLTSEKAKAVFNKDIIIKQMQDMPDETFNKNSEVGAESMITDREKAKDIAQWGKKSDRKTLASVFYEMSTVDLRESITNINLPVLILGSIHGTVKETQELFDIQYKNLKNKTIHIADSKHFIMFDKPEWFYNEITSFE